MAFMALLAADVGINPDQYRQWARSQIGYALGDTGRSFVVGFGTNPPQRPHHRSRYNKLIITVSGAKLPKNFDKSIDKPYPLINVKLCKSLHFVYEKIDVQLIIITCNLGENIFNYMYLQIYVLFFQYPCMRVLICVSYTCYLIGLGWI